MQFIGGMVAGVVGYAIYDFAKGNATPQVQKDPERDKLEERLATTLNALAGTETANKKLMQDLQLAQTRNKELEGRVNSAVATPMKIDANAPKPPPPPPSLGKGERKRGFQARIDSKTLLAQFAAFIEKAENRDCLNLVKTALRLDFPTLSKTTERAVKQSLENIIGKWIKEHKCPENVDSEKWEEVVDESLADMRSESLDRYFFPNAALVVKDGVSFLRTYFQPKSQATQGKLVDELSSKLAKRPKREPQIKS